MSDMSIDSPVCAECCAPLSDGLGVMVRPVRFYADSTRWRPGQQRIQMNTKRKFFCAKCMPLGEKDWGGFQHNKGAY